MVKTDTVKRLGPMRTFDTSGQRQTIVMVEHQTVTVGATVFDVVKQPASQRVRQWYGTPSLLRLRPCTIHAVAERHAFNPGGQAFHLAWRQMLRLPFDKDDKPIPVMSQLVDA